MATNNTIRDFNKDYGQEPSVIAVSEVTANNDFFRRTIWTGEHLQMTIMSINVGDDIGLEVHNKNDQLLVIQKGQAKITMGQSQDSLDEWNASAGEAIFVPAGVWHNIINSSQEVLKLYSVYAGPEHNPGTTNKDKPSE